MILSGILYESIGYGYGYGEVDGIVYSFGYYPGLVPVDESIGYYYSLICSSGFVYSIGFGYSIGLNYSVGFS